MRKFRGESEALKVLPGADFCLVLKGKASWKVLPTLCNGSLKAATYPCYFYKDTGLPCVHIVAVAKSLNWDVFPLIDGIYLNSYYHKIYSTAGGVNPVSHTSEEIIADESIALPQVPISRGRPKVQYHR